MVFKCINKEVGCNSVFQPSHTTFTRGHSKKLTKETFRTNALKHNFFVRVVDAWNQLPSTVNDQPLVDAPNSKVFKRLLQNVNLDHHLKYYRFL